MRIWHVGAWDVPGSTELSSFVVPSPINKAPPSNSFVNNEGLVDIDCFRENTETLLLLIIPRAIVLLSR